MYRKVTFDIFKIIERKEFLIKLLHCIHIGLPDTLSLQEWIISVLPENSTIGIDPFLINFSDFASWSGTFQSNGLSLVGVNGNLVDMIWTTRPALNLSGIDVLDIKFSGIPTNYPQLENKRKVKYHQ